MMKRHLFPSTLALCGLATASLSVGAAPLDLSSSVSDASTAFSASYDPAGTFEGTRSGAPGDAGIRWASAVNGFNTSEWIWIDLGSDLTIQSVLIDWESSDAVSYTIRMLADADATTLGLSADGTATGDLNNWTTIATAVGLPERAPAGGDGNDDDDSWDFTTGTSTIQGGVGTGSATVDITNPVGRYLLINPTQNATDNNSIYSIWEIEVTAVPEPGSLALLAMGGLCVLRRRRY